MKKRQKRHLFGFGFDNTDGHKRITCGENFTLLGGSSETHEEMQEKTIKLNELIKKKHLDLDHIRKDILNDIARQAGLFPVKPPQKKRTRGPS